MQSTIFGANLTEIRPKLDRNWGKNMKKPASDTRNLKLLDLTKRTVRRGLSSVHGVDDEQRSIGANVSNSD
jgi:hypothetical protein